MSSSKRQRLPEGRKGFRVADLFCGAGGLAEGFRQAGCSIVVGSDADPDACATFSLNFPEATTVHGDLRQPDVKARVTSTAGDRIDILVGGPPCQAFSQVRNHARLIDDPRNSLYREFVGMLRALEPRAFVMENVPGLEQMGVREQVMEDLAVDGLYSVRSQVVDAADFGVPQTRKRIIFFGIDSSLDIDPPIMHGSGATTAFSLQRRNGGSRVRYRVTPNRSLLVSIDQLNDGEDTAFVTAEQALSDLDVLTAGERQDEMPVDVLKAPVSAYQRRMREGLGPVIRNVSVPRLNEDTRLRLMGLPPGGNFRDLPEELTERYLTGERWGPSNGTGRLGRKHFYAYRRLHPGLWSWTLNTKADSVYHYRRARALSVREFARLQSFPDRFVFTTDPRPGELPGRIDGGAAHSRYRQAGNAVPPLLGRAIATALLERLTTGLATRKRSA
ncbi:MAG: DNA cytosine methyltransferase [Vicinamibacterales bacterium]